MANAPKVTIPAKFFEETPLYNKVEVDLPERAEWLMRGETYPPINLECENCGSRQTFTTHGTDADGWCIDRK